MKAATFYRIAAVLILLFDVGHTAGYPWSNPKWGVDLSSMRSTSLQEFFPNELYDEDNYNVSCTATGIGTAIVLRIAREWGKSMEWLLTGEGK